MRGELADLCVFAPDYRLEMRELAFGLGLVLVEHASYLRGLTQQKYVLSHFLGAVAELIKDRLEH